MEERNTTQRTVDTADTVEARREEHGVGVRLAGITKRFGEFTAVDDVSLDILEGEFFSLLGPSGCGKTTILRMIAGFEEPTVGEISVSGEPVHGVPPYRRPVNTVFQSYAIFPHLDVFDNVAFGLKRARVAKDEIRRRVTEACAMVKLEGYEKRKPSKMSGGQQQRVALARALINRPKVLLLDEPLGALDLKLRKEMQIELKILQETVGITFVYVTHDQEEALTMSDRIAVMDAGKVRQVADPATLYETPHNRFVADFIGQTNVISGTAESVSQRRMTLRTASGTRVEAALQPGIHAEEGAETHAAVRPEKLRFSASGDNVASAKVVQAIYLGSSTNYLLELPGGERMTLQQQNTHDATGNRPGDEVTVAWDAANCLVLGA